MTTVFRELPGDINQQNGGIPVTADAGGGTERPTDKRAAGKPNANKKLKEAKGNIENAPKSANKGVSTGPDGGSSGGNIEKGPQAGKRVLTGKGKFPNSIPDHE